MYKERSIRILHILGSSLVRGGTETNTISLVNYMRGDFLNVLCFLSERGPVGEDLEQAGFAVYYLPLSNVLSLPIVALRLYRLLRANHFDILHLYGLKANFLGRIVGRLSGHNRILGGLRNKYPSQINKSWILWLDRLTFGCSLGYVSNSKAAVDFLVSHGYDSRKFWVIHNGIDTNVLNKHSEKETIKQEYELPPDVPIITCVANLRPSKGHEYLIRALYELKSEGLGFRALLVGDGPLHGELERLVQKLELEKQVLFLGFKDREDIPEILAITDFLVLSSLWEGLPTAIIEAMAAGCPVVATAVGGSPELIIEGQTGFLVRPRDSRALAQKMRLLLEDPKLCKNMGKAGAERAKEYFSLERMVREYESLYKRFMSKNRPQDR